MEMLHEQQSRLSSGTGIHTRVHMAMYTLRKRETETRKQKVHKTKHSNNKNKTPCPPFMARSGNLLLTGAICVAGHRDGRSLESIRDSSDGDRVGLSWSKV